MEHIAAVWDGGAGTSLMPSSHSLGWIAPLIPLHNSRSTLYHNRGTLSNPLKLHSESTRCVVTLIVAERFQYFGELLVGQNDSLLYCVIISSGINTIGSFMYSFLSIGVPR
eukprot:13081418-Ditylum_brightwellii.AAC.2